MVKVYIGIGSNLERERSIAGALESLRQRFGAVHCSPVYECAAVGFDGAPFYNLVATFRTALAIDALTDTLHAIERDHGRGPRAHGTVSRTVDLDLLLYGDTVSAAQRVPRADIESYAFVLRPLAELAGDECHPVSGRTYAAMWAERRSRQHATLAPVEVPMPAGVHGAGR